MDVYLCHTQEDALAAEEIRTALDVVHLRSFVGSRTLPVEFDRAKTLQAVGDARAVVYVHSQKALVSQRVSREIDIALSANKRLFVLRLDAAELDDVVVGYANCAEPIDARAAPLAPAIRRLVRQLSLHFESFASPVHLHTGAAEASPKPRPPAVSSSESTVSHQASAQPSLNEQALQAAMGAYNNKEYKVSFEAFLHVANTASDPVAQHAVAMHYQEGQGVASDRAESIRWYRLAAEQGLAMSQFNLGLVLGFGPEATPENREEAATLFRRAADQGHTEAQLAVGNCYERGDGVERDFGESVRWYRRAADEGFPPAMIKLCHAYEFGQGVEPDMAIALQWLRRAADLGDPTAQVRLARCYGAGYGVERDLKIAATWFRKSADQGEPEALVDLAELHVTGSGVQKDDAEAARLFRAAADKGHVQAQWRLAQLYEQGTGVERSTSHAEIWYGEAARRGHPEAQARIRKSNTPRWRPSKGRVVGLLLVGSPILAAVVYVAIRAGFWCDVFLVHCLIVCDRFGSSVAVMPLNTNTVADIIGDVKASNFILAARKCLACPLMLFWLAWFWPHIYVARFRAAFELFRAGRAVSQREIVKRVVTNEVMMEVYAAGCAAASALFVTLVPLPNWIARTTSFITVAACLSFLLVSVLVPKAVPERAKTTSDWPVANLVALGLFLYIALMLSFARLDTTGATFRERAWTITRAIVFPAHDWIRPWLAAQCDDLTNQRFHLVTRFALAAKGGPSPLQVVELLSGLLFYMSVVATLLSRDKLARDLENVLEYVSYLLRLSEFERALTLLNTVDSTERTFRWSLARALVELGRGDRHGQALGFARKATKHYEEQGVQCDPEALLYQMAIEFELPSSSYSHRIPHWLNSESCTDTELWKVMVLALLRSQGLIVFHARPQVSEERFPLTHALFLVDKRCFDEARTALNKIHPSDSETRFEHLYLSYLVDTLHGTPSPGDWVERNATQTQAVLRAVRSEYLVRVALEWLQLLPRNATVGSARASEWRDLETELVQRYNDGSGLMKPAVLVARVAALAFGRRVVKRWPRLAAFNRRVQGN